MPLKQNDRFQRSRGAEDACRWEWQSTFSSDELATRGQRAWVGGGKTQVALAKVAGGNGPKPMQDSPMVVSDIGADLPICLDTTVQSSKSRQLRETRLN